MNSGSRFATIEVSDEDLEVDGVRHVTVRSAALGGRGDLTLWVPDRPGPLPISVLLHGVYGSHWLWAYKAGVHRTAARLLAEDQIPPMVLAMPSDGLWEDGSCYLTVPGRDVEAWIVDEVPDAVEAVVPGASAEAGLCLGGLSMGGFGALRLGARHPGRYRGLAALSAITEFDQMRHFTATPLERYGTWPEDWALGPSLVATGDRLPPLRFVCGTEDPLLAGNRHLHHQLDKADVEHIYQEHPGGHDWPFWARHAAETLIFFGSCLGRRRELLH